MVKIEKTEKANGVWCYRILGLNVFAVNKVEVEEYLDLKFIADLTQPYKTICLIGAPAPANWKNEMKRQGKTVRIEDLLGAGSGYYEIPLWYYGGNFGKYSQEYGSSLLIELRNKKMLHELSEVFGQWDALALLLYREGKEGLTAAQNALSEFTTETALMNALLQEAMCVVLTQADCQYLEVYTKASVVAEEVDAAAKKAEEFIKRTDWYQKHKANLVWDETELCYVSNS
jgi:energy-converting hydrogenase Eha subunit C